MAIAVLMALSITAVVTLTPAPLLGAATPETERALSARAPAEFLRFLETLDAAQKRLQNGDATAYKNLWSHGDDVTLAGGFGGMVEKGWPAVSRRLDWAATQFSNGETTIERLATRVRGDLGYVVQIERIRFVVPGQTVESNRLYRVTMIFERISTGWRVVHRHADVQVAKQPVRQ